MIPRDLSPFSTSSRTQLWIIERMQDTFSIIKSLPFGLCLGFKGNALTMAVDDGTDAFRWKFVQNQKGIQFLPKSDLSFALSTVSGSSAAANQIDDTANWILSRSSGTPMEVNLAQGTYLISLFAQITRQMVTTQAQTTKSALSSQKIDGAVSYVDQISSRYEFPICYRRSSDIASYKLPPGSQGLSSGVNLKQVESQLATSGETDASGVPTFRPSVAKSVTQILTVFFGTLYQQSIKPKTTGTTSSSKDAGSTQGTKPTDGSSSADSTGESLR